MLRAVLGSFVILAGVLAGTCIVLVALALSDTFPPSKTFGQNMALLSIYLAGFLLSYLFAEVGAKLIRDGWTKRKLKA
jgi:hypothetical protein